MSSFSDWQKNKSTPQLKEGKHRRSCGTEYSKSNYGKHVYRFKSLSIRDLLEAITATSASLRQRGSERQRGVWVLYVIAFIFICEILLRNARQDICRPARYRLVACVGNAISRNSRVLTSFVIKTRIKSARWTSRYLAPRGKTELYPK